MTEPDETPTAIEPARSVGSGTTGATGSTGSTGATGSTGSTGARTAPASTPTVGSRSAFGTASVALPKPEAILRRAAFEQTRRTAVSGVIFNVMALLVGPLMDGDRAALRVFVLAAALGLVNNAWLLVVCRDESRHRQRWALLYFGVATLSNAGVLLYLGTFGPVLVMFVLNVYTACLAYTRRVARLVLGGAIAPFTALGLAIASGALRDPGLVTVSGVVGPIGQGVMVFAFVLFLSLTYAQARRTRDLMVGSLVERDRAIRLASHREALLLEARGDLERALQAGGLGRFSEQTLGAFRLGAIIGRGGMGEVYEATHLETGEPAAVKLLLPEVLGRPTYVRRFLREVKIAASLDSPHVVRVLAFGDEHAPMPFLAMERLVGEDLAQRLRRRPRMDPSEVVVMVRELARGVDAAAAAGIVHRDLKPQNLFHAVGPRPTWKILDFGVSRMLSDDGALTRGDAVGTPRYMAPEQARGEAVDTRADIYALGAIAYRALTGRPPFAGEDGAPVLVEVLSRMPARPGAIAKLPADVDAVMAIALAKRPEHRFDSAEGLARALEAAALGRLDAELRDRARAQLVETPWGPS